jgi:hypothetical protein
MKQGTFFSATYSDIQVMFSGFKGVDCFLVFTCLRVPTHPCYTGAARADTTPPSPHSSSQTKPSVVSAKNYQIWSVRINSPRHVLEGGGGGSLPLL